MTYRLGSRLRQKRWKFHLGVRLVKSDGGESDGPRTVTGGLTRRDKVENQGEI